MSSESKGTVVLALSANTAIAIAKTAAGLITLSSSMLAEAAHSWADTMNQIFLLTSLKRSEKPADSMHPFGYGKERFFWSLLAAVGIFVTGAGFSIFEGVHTLLSGSHSVIPATEYYISYAVLAISFLLEGSSLLKALRQIKGEARERGRTVPEHVRKSNDPTVKTVVSEDSAAVAGLVLAGIGLGLHQVTGSALYDGAASVIIGLLLGWIAYALGRDTKDLLIGESADPELRLDIIHVMTGFDEIDHVLELLTMQLSPEEVLVAAKVDFAANATSDGIEKVSSDVERALKEKVPSVKHVFLDATTPNAEQLEAARDIEALALADDEGDDEAPERLTDAERKRDARAEQARERVQASDRS